MNILQKLAASLRTPEKHCYFPPVTARERSLIKKATKGARLNEPRMLEACAALSASRLAFTPFDFHLEEHAVRICQGKRNLAFPRPIPPVKFTLLVYGYLRWLERKYSLPGFCEVEAGDRVIDCGAYVGGFGLGTLGKASRVDFFEPDLANYVCLRQNLDGAAGAFAHQAGLYSEAGVMSLNRSASSVEHSFLAPDDGAILEMVEVNIQRLDEFANAEGIEEIDFLKIEAEGVEIEVYQGVGDLPVKKVVVDISPERDGKSPREYFEQTLTSKGYEVRVRENVLFGKRREG